ncbi:MAG: divergent polysaccharide deacetylase family protein [Geminicoccaceae bacterium]
MPRLRLPVRLRTRRAAAVLAAGLLAVGFAAAATALPSGSVRYVGPAPTVVPIAHRLEPPAAVATPARMARLSLAEPELGIGPPAALDPSLLEQTPEGALPRLAPDGTGSLARYARPSPGPCQRPCVALLVTGLGLVAKLTERAFALPAAIALSFSPYADARDWQARARAAGHEVLLSLPLKPVGARDDAGPLTVPAGGSSADVRAALRRVLATGGGFVAVDATAGAFATASGPAAAMAEELHARGLGLIEVGGDRLAAAALAAGLPYRSATAVDSDPTPEAIDRGLAQIAATALRAGQAVAVAGALPVAFERIMAWSARLDAQGIELVPPSRLLLAAPDPALARR